MATLTIRNLPDDVRERLKIRAARGGRSMEAEVRAILCRASLEDARENSFEALQSWVHKLYGERPPRGTVEALLAERRRQAERGE